MNFLPAAAIEEIKAHDASTWAGNNRTRFYKYLLLAGRDMEIHAVAVKADKQKRLFVKEVVRASVDDPWMYLKDISFFYGMAGYVVDWSDAGLGPKQSWAYRGRWASEVYQQSRAVWKLSCHPVINPEALLAHDRFRYCAWTPECGDILDFLKIYAKHPRVELLAKTEGAARFATRIGFIQQIEKDKGLMRFFLANLAEIEKYCFGVDVIRLAYKRGCALTESSRRIQYRRDFRGLGLPKTIDATRAHAYVAKQKTSDRRYCGYLRNCQTLGLDLADTKTAFPKRFNRREKIIGDQIIEVERRKNAELAKLTDKQLESVVTSALTLEKVRSKAFRVVLPRRAADFVREGKRLKNCLGDGHYVRKMAKGETLIAFIRKAARPNAAFVAVEYDLRQKRVMQCYGANNSKPSDLVFKFVNRLFTAKGIAA